MNDVQPHPASTAEGFRRPSRAQRRETALAAARDILAAEGMAALTARRIAGAIGAAVGTLYNLFENFDEIVLALNLETLQGLEQALAALPPAEPEAAILAIADAYLDFTAANRHRWDSVLGFKTDRPHRFAEDFPAVIGGLVGRVEQALAPLYPPGAEHARRLSAAVLWTSLEGIGALTAANNLRMVAPTSASAMARALVVNYVAGVSVLTGTCATTGTRLSHSQAL